MFDVQPLGSDDEVMAVTDQHPLAHVPDEEAVVTDMLITFGQTEPSLAWMQLLVDLRLARMVHAAVRLGIVDAISSKTLATGEIASTTATDPAALLRLLRALTVAGVVVESEPGRFALTRTGSLLLSGSRPSFGDALLDFFEPTLVPLDGLVRTLQTGRPVLEELHGMSFYDYLNREAPERAGQFNASMNHGAVMRALALLACSDLSSAATVVDVGGGEGVLIANVLRAYPHLRGVVVERQQTATRARARLATSDVATRCLVVTGDFFSAIPVVGDVFVLSFVLHNWDDDECIILLSECSRAMNQDGTLLIVEQVHSPEQPASIIEYLNLSSIELLAGRERTISQYAELLKAAGFRLADVTRAPNGPFHVLAARIASANQN